MMQTSQNNFEGPNWQDLLLDILGHWLLIAVFFVFTTAGTYVTLQLMTPQYESTAALLVKLGRENMQVPTTVNAGSVFSSGVRAEEINSGVRLLRSRELLEETVDTIGLEAFRGSPPEPQTLLEHIKAAIKSVAKTLKGWLEDLLIAIQLKVELPEREKIIMGVSESISVERIRESDVIHLSIQLPDPTLAQKVLQTMLEIFTERHIEVRRDAPMQQFFSTQAQSHLDTIRAIEGEMEALRDEHNIGSVEDQRIQLIARLHTLEAELDRNRHELALLGDTIDLDAAQDLDIEPSNSKGSVSVEPVKERMTQLRIERIKLSRRYDLDSRMIEALDAELAELGQTLAASLLADVAQLERQVEDIENEIVSLNSAEIRLGHLQDDLVIARENYAEYHRRTEDARISEEMDLRRVMNVSVLDPPTLGMKPVKPRKLLIMAISMPLGLLIGIGVAMLLEYLNDTVRTHRDLSGVDGLNYLGMFRLEKGAGQGRSASPPLSGLNRKPEGG